MTETQGASAKAGLGGADISNILQSDGPIVTCVVLRTARREDPLLQNGLKDQTAKTNQTTLVPAPKMDGKALKDEAKKEKYPFSDMIEEIRLDTTPAKNQVADILEGPSTFLGQYEEEGIVLISRRGWIEEESEGTEQTWQKKDFDSMSIKQLRAQCTEWDVCTTNIAEKQELVTALKQKEQQLPLVNPHPLQPPLQNTRVRGDILILKVAGVGEPLDKKNSNVSEDKGTDEEQDDEHAKKETKKGDTDHLNSLYGEFFLNYSKKEYLAFAVRTDVVPPNSLGEGVEEASSDDAEDGNGDDEDVDNSNEDENDDPDHDDYHLAEDMEMTEEEEKSAMLNIVMSELLRKFREENGRGPDTRELLEIRASVAEQLGMEVATLEEPQEPSDDKCQEERNEGGKRKAQSVKTRSPGHDSEENSNRKKVKFDSNLVSEHHFEYASDESEEETAANNKAANPNDAAPHSEEDTKIPGG